MQASAVEQHSMPLMQNVMGHNMQTQWTGLKMFGIAAINQSQVDLNVDDRVWISVANESANIYHININFKFSGPLSRIPPLAPKQLIGNLSTKLKSEFDLHDINNTFSWNALQGILTWTLHIKDTSANLIERIKAGETVVSSLFDLT